MSDRAEPPAGDGGEWGHIDPAELPIVPAGEPLIDHEVYIDVLNPGNGPFRALPGQIAGSGNGYVAESSVNPVTWDHLVREDAEAGLRQEVEREAEEETGHPVDPGISGIGHTS